MNHRLSHYTTVPVKSSPTLPAFRTAPAGNSASLKWPKAIIALKPSSEQEWHFVPAKFTTGTDYTAVTLTEPEPLLRSVQLPSFLPDGPPQGRTSGWPQPPPRRLCQSKHKIHLGNLPSHADVITIQCYPLDVKRQEFPFVHFAFIYNFCESFPVAWTKNSIVLDDVTSDVDIKFANYRWCFFSMNTCVSDAFPNQHRPKKRDRVNFCRFLQHVQRSHPTWSQVTDEEINKLEIYSFIHDLTRHTVTSSGSIMPHLLPWACDICQCPTLHLWSPRMVRGKAVTSPALNMSGMFVLMNCQAGQTRKSQQQSQ